MVNPVNRVPHFLMGDRCTLVAPDWQTYNWPMTSTTPNCNPLSPRAKPSELVTFAWDFGTVYNMLLEVLEYSPLTMSQLVRRLPVVADADMVAFNRADGGFSHSVALPQKG